MIERLQNHIPAFIASNDIPGMAIGLVHRDRLIWTGGFGFTDRSRREKVTAETLFSLQSVSKTYTAAAVLKAVEDGLLRLDDPLTRYLPDFSVNSRYGDAEVRKITLRHLLSHRAGLCDEAPVGSNYDDRPCTFAEHVRSISNSWLVCPVGTAFRYSNLGIDLAGHVLALQTGRPFEHVLKDSIFNRLGMKASTFTPPRFRRPEAISALLNCLRSQFP